MEKSRLQLPRPALIAGLVLLAALVAGSGTLYAQDYDLDYSPSFFIDLNYFKAPSGDTFLVELHLKVPVNHFIFTKQDTAFLARYRLAYILFDDNDRQVGGAELIDSLWLHDYAATHSTGRFRPMQTSFRLAPGDYEVKVILTDLNASQPSVYVKHLELPKIVPGEELFSDLRFLGPSWSRNWDSLLTLPRAKVQPLVSNRYLLGDEDTLVFLYELYGLQDAPTRYKVRYTLRDHNRKHLVSVEESLRGTESLHYARLSLLGVPAGRGDLLLELFRNELPVATREKEIRLSWSRTGLVRRDWTLALDELHYVANEEELDSLEKVPDSLREAAFRVFWKKHDPTPSTPENELEDEYYRRVEYANEKYGGMRQGYETDPGTVYITYGEPDEVESHPFELSTKSYQIWYYYNQNLKFIFVDKFGDGELTLVRKERI